MTARRGDLVIRMASAATALAALVGLVFLIMLLAVREVREATRWVDHSDQVISVANELAREASDLQAGLRGFLITGQEPFLDPYRAARRQAPLTALRLQGLVRDNPGQAAGAVELSRLVEAYAIEHAGPAIEGARRGAHSSREDSATVTRGERRTEALRARFAAFIAEEQRLRDARHADADARARWAVGLAVGGLLTLALLIALWGVYYVRTIVLPVRRLIGATRRFAGGDLMTRVAEGGRGEVADLGRLFNRMAAGLAEAQDQLERQNALLEHQQSELQQSVAELSDEKERVVALNRVGQRLASEAELGPLTGVLLQGAAGLANADVATLYVATDDAADAMTCISTLGIEPALLPERITTATGLAGRAVAERRTIAAQGPHVGLELETLGRRVVVSHELHVPLLQGQRALGVLTLARAAATPFSRVEVETVEYAANQGAIALANALSFRDSRLQARINQAVLDGTPDAIALFSVDGSLLVANEPMRQLASDLGDADALESRPDGDPTAESRDELRLPGDRTLARFTGPVRDAGGRLIGRVVVLRDVTAEREADRLKEEFFALVSHELRTPLTSIVGYLELLQLDDPDGAPTEDESQRFLAVVERNARRLLRLVGDMLFVAEVESGRLSLSPSQIDLAALAADCVESARPRAEAHDVELRLDASEALRCSGDPDRLAQALDNVLSNAIKFTPPGGHIDVVASAHGDDAVLTVADTGIGIAHGEQPHLFERFFRASAATQRAIQGVGLGLSIVRTIVEGHGGRVSIDSTEGAGTTVRLELPLLTAVPSVSQEPA